MAVTGSGAANVTKNEQQQHEQNILPRPGTPRSAIITTPDAAFIPDQVEHKGHE